MCSQSGYICLDFHRRAHDLAELQMGKLSPPLRTRLHVDRHNNSIIIIQYLFLFFCPKSGQPSRRPEDACNSANFDAHATDSITLVGKSLIAKIFQVFVERPSAISR